MHRIEAPRYIEHLSGAEFAAAHLSKCSPNILN